MSKNRKPSSQLRSRSGVGEATQSGCGAEVRRGWAGEGGGTNASCAGERERERANGRVSIEATWPLDLDVGEGRGDFEAELDAVVAGRRNAGRRELVEEEEAGGLEVWWPRFNHLDSGLGAVLQLRSARRDQLSDWARRAGVERRWIGAVVAADARCRPKERKEETDRGAVEMLIESEKTVRRQWRAQIGSELRGRQRSSLGGLRGGVAWAVEALDARAVRALRLSAQRSGSRRGTAIYL
ncbi:hypothetical protein ACQKWADRAFT_313068 [Trichoderma austrokoningii]